MSIFWFSINSAPTQSVSYQLSAVNQIAKKLSIIQTSTKSVNSSAKTVRVQTSVYLFVYPWLVCIYYFLMIFICGTLRLLVYYHRYSTLFTSSMWVRNITLTGIHFVYSLYTLQVEDYNLKPLALKLITSPKPGCGDFFLLFKKKIKPAFRCASTWKLEEIHNSCFFQKSIIFFWYRT